MLTLTFGPSFLWEFSMLMSMRKVVTMRDILPGTMSAGMRNPMKETATRRDVGRYTLMMNGFTDRRSTILKPAME